MNGLYDNLSPADLDAIGERLASGSAPQQRADAVALLAEVRRLRLELAIQDQLVSELFAVAITLARGNAGDAEGAPIPYELTPRGMSALRRDRS